MVSPVMASVTVPLIALGSCAEASPAVKIINPAISSVMIPILVFNVGPPGSGLALITIPNGPKLAVMFLVVPFE